MGVAAPGGRTRTAPDVGLTSRSALARSDLVEGRSTSWSKGVWTSECEGRARLIKEYFGTQRVGPELSSYISPRGIVWSRQPSRPALEHSNTPDGGRRGIADNIELWRALLGQDLSSLKRSPYRGSIRPGLNSWVFRTSQKLIAESSFGPSQKLVWGLILIRSNGESTVVRGRVLT